MKRSTMSVIIFFLLIANIFLVGNEPRLTSGDGNETFYFFEAPYVTRGISHSIIRINNNNEFSSLATTEGWSGNGQLTTPYIIENLIIDAKENGNCIYIGNTTVYFVIRNCKLINASCTISPWEYGCGITLYNVQNGSISSNNISNNNMGIYLYSSNFNIIENNTCNQNELNGIRLEFYSDTNVLTNNTCQLNNFSGIYIYGMSHNNKIKSNNCTKNNYYGITINSCDKIYLENNICNKNNFYGISFVGSRWNNVTNNICNQNNISGIYLSHVISSNITDNICNLNNDTGINLSASNDNILDNNICNINKGIGIFLSLSNNNIITNCNFSNNDVGIELMGVSIAIINNRFYENYISYNTKYGLFFTGVCTNNRFFHNNIISNAIQASGSAGGIIWDDSNGEGNYWSDYTGLDNGAGGRPMGDGIGDTQIPHLTYDNYPFIFKSGWRILPLPILNDPGEFNNTGVYTISWKLTHRAAYYYLEEDDDQYYSSPTLVYNGSELSVDLTGKDNGTYYYRLKAFNDYTESDWSQTVKISVDWAPIAPTGLVAINTMGHNITLKWTANSEQDIRKYFIYINETDAGSSGPFQYYYSIDIPCTEYRITGLFEETTYHFVVAALDNSSSLSQYSNVASATTTDETKPAPPTGLNATAISDSKIKLTWNSNNEADVMGYFIYMNVSGGDPERDFQLINTSIGSITSYLVTNDIIEQVTYYFRIVAFDEVPNNSTPSDIISVTTPDLTKPNKPIGLSVSNPTSDSLTISWDANSDPDLVGYILYYNISLFGEYKPINSESIIATHYIHINLNEDTTYYYKLTAIDDYGLESPFSDYAVGSTLIAQHPPEINNTISDFNIPEDTYDSTNLYFFFKDINNDPLTFQCEGQQHLNVTIFQINGTMILRPEKNWNGKEMLTVYANDGFFIKFVKFTVNITITPVNDPPEQVKIISPQDGIIIKSGKLLNFNGIASDPDLIYGDNLTFTWSSSIDQELGTGMNISNIELSPGSHVITFKVSDKAGMSTNTTIDIKVEEKEDEKSVANHFFTIIILVIIIIIIIIVVVGFNLLRKKKKPPKKDMKPSGEELVAQPVTSAKSYQQELLHSIPKYIPQSPPFQQQPTKIIEQQMRGQYYNQQIPQSFPQAPQLMFNVPRIPPSSLQPQSPLSKNIINAKPQEDIRELALKRAEEKTEQNQMTSESISKDTNSIGTESIGLLEHNSKFSDRHDEPDKPSNEY